MSARHLSLALVASLVATSSLSQAAPDASAGVTDAGIADAGIADAAAPGADGGADIGGCVETIPKGSQRPRVVDVFPLHGTSGWAATLSVTVEHGRGERVLPSGLDLSSAAEAKKVLQKAGFVLPDQDGGAAAQLWSAPDDAKKSTVETHLDLSVVTLPAQPGRNTLELPPLPVAIARANGEIVTVCTRSHTIVVEDPIASVPDAQPRQNPPPRPQREEWTSLKKALQYAAIGIAIGAALAYLAYRIVTRPKPVPPPPPPRPPWEIALEKLDEVRHAGLLEGKRHGEYFDRVSDAVRGYLGARFGFDGLESTTDEILAALTRQGAGFIRLDEEERPRDRISGLPAPGVPLAEIRRFLAQADLVKFANLTPDLEQCEKALVVGERIVRATMPVSRAPYASPDDDDDTAPPAPAAPAPAPATPAPPSRESPPRSPYAPPGTDDGGDEP